jgi:excisionase family DNA binding protein
MIKKFALSVPEFCQLYGVGRSTAYKEMKEGRLRYVHVGRRRLIPYDAAEDWFASLPGQNRTDQGSSRSVGENH